MRYAICDNELYGQQEADFEVSSDDEIMHTDGLI